MEPAKRPIALTRPVSDSIALCELTHLSRTAIDLERARRQHAAYEAALEACGLEVYRLPVAPELADAVFVEDTALVVEELAVMTRPGAASRRAELPAVAGTLDAWRPVEWISAPATLDGGDVLRVGRRLWVGRSSRTNAPGVEQLARVLAPYGYEVAEVEVAGCLHLKSAVTAVGKGKVLLNPRWVDPAAFDGLDAVEIDPAEPFAANALRVGDRLVYPTAFPRTAERLEADGYELVEVDVSELAKAEGAVTCCSVIVSRPG